MDAEKILILIEDKDKTEQIEQCKGTQIKFFNNEKTYNYSRPGVIQCYEARMFLDPRDYLIARGDRILDNIKKIIDFGDYVKVYYNEKETPILYKKEELDIKASALATPSVKEVFEYLKSLSEVVSIKSDDGKVLLQKKYESVTFLDSETVLSDYLGMKLSSTNMEDDGIMVYPFGLNASQKRVVEKVFANKISVIEGPPGTGKTQTILNIIANIIMKGKTVAVVSNNNSATSNVVEKLEKNDLSFFAAFLGKNDNKEKFIENQREDIPKLKDWKLDKEQVEYLLNDVERLSKELDKKLISQTNLVQKKLELSLLKTEKHYFDEYLADIENVGIDYLPLNVLNSEQIYKLWIEFLHQENTKGKFTLYFRIRNMFVYGFWKQDFYKRLTPEIITDYQRRYYSTRINELEDEIIALNNELENYGFTEKMKEITDSSLKLFKYNLYKKYGGNKNRRVFTKGSFMKESQDFLEEYPLILSTTHSLLGSLHSRTIYDYLIIDEASQVDIVSGALTLACAKNVVVVGDLKQLPNVVTSGIEKRVAPILKKFQPNKGFDYTAHSLLSSFLAIFPNAARTLLKEHYRCHPKIIQFCNQKFYNNELIIMTDNNDKNDTLKAFITTEGNHARGHYNQRQIDVIKKEMMPLLGCATENLGIVSPYREQRDALKDQIVIEDVVIDTVHKFQGRERNDIILTTVDNVISNFVDNPNMLNVAVSRAKERLFVVVSNDDRNASTNIDDLVRYINYNNLEVVHSKIYSVFDILYKGFTERRMEYINVVSKYDSENLMYQLILKVLAEERFIKFGVKCQYRLRELIKDTELLTEDEVKYAMNGNTTVDFLIFDESSDKMPALAIEVDGYKYHKKGTKQSLRDKKKNAILEKYNIPCIRFNTVESCEEERLVEKLDDILAKGNPQRNV